MARRAGDLAAECLGPSGDICVHLTIANRIGSVEHYFHFLLGFFIPLARHLAGPALDRRIGEILVRSCGPMDSHLRALGDPRLVILDKPAHDAARGRATTATQRFKLIRGYDMPRRFDRAVFAQIRDIMLARSDVQAEIAKARAEWGSARARLLLIRRGPPDPFYLSRKAEAQGAGTSRRSVPNHDELRRALAERFGGVLDAALEGVSLARQIALFHLADIVVAQHGAALANLVWTRQTTRAVEIFPRTLIADYHPESAFRKLAHRLKMHHSSVWQDDVHAAVDAAALCDAVAHRRPAWRQALEIERWRISFLATLAAINAMPVALAARRGMSLRAQVH